MDLVVMSSIDSQIEQLNNYVSLKINSLRI